jgi:hypothetical protein
METVKFDLPVGAQLRGQLYRDPGTRYGTGDVLEIELPTGYVIDVGWDDEHETGTFTIVVYRDYWGNQTQRVEAKSVEDAVTVVERLAKVYSFLNSESPASETSAS